MTISLPKDRALELSQRPDIQEWIKQLKQVVETTPKDVWVFVAGGVHVMACDEEGQSYMHESYPNFDNYRCGVIQDALMDSFDTPLGQHMWDGGDW